uniref:Uncharacterized protein n=1 Tax=Lactuca sativa TaxID=4236 RepID=A0A9R1VJ33_LACSA|nr:hypothetical protein LSAT_V11C500242770 [Lactuca sativa]
MSHNENSSSSNEYSGWETRVVQNNRQLDEIITELLIQDHPPRARRRYCDREREQGEARLMEDYFVDSPTYDQVTFWRRFRMQRPLFLRIVIAVTATDLYFQQRRGATGRQAMRVLAYGTSADAQDEYMRMSETVTRDAVIKFVEGVIACFGEKYLRRPNEVDLARLLYVGEERGLPYLSLVQLKAQIQRPKS